MRSQSRARAAAGAAFRYGGRAAAHRGIGLRPLIADKAFDSNPIIAELDARGAKVVISEHPRRAQPLAIDKEMYKWRHLIDKLLRQTQGIQAHRNARRQDRPELHLHDLSGRGRDKLQMNPNRP
jgi:hypothetical protein